MKKTRELFEPNVTPMWFYGSCTVYTANKKNEFSCIRSNPFHTFQWNSLRSNLANISSKCSNWISFCSWHKSIPFVIYTENRWLISCYFNICTQEKKHHFPSHFQWMTQCKSPEYSKRPTKSFCSMDLFALARCCFIQVEICLIWKFGVKLFFFYFTPLNNCATSENISLVSPTFL